MNDGRRPVIIPSLASILAWAEAESGAELEREDVELLASQAPSMTLPIHVASAFEQARGFADLDPEAAFDAWLCRREQTERQGVPVANALPAPRVQLQPDLKILQQLLTSTGEYPPAVIASQVAALFEYASNWLTELEQSFRG